MGGLENEFEDESILVSRCSQGDRHSFDALWTRHRKRIFHFIFVRVGDLNEAEDLAQETFVRAWASLSKGTEVSALSAWLYSIARNVVNDWVRSRKRMGITGSLEDQINEATPGPSLEQKVEAKLSFEFLSKQLDEVLIEGATTASEKKMGYLRKLSFMYFYVDGMTVPQISIELELHAQTIGLPSTPLTQLNNWLSRGDILGNLVRHLVQDHSNWISATIQKCLGQLSHPSSETEIARLRWQEGLSLEIISEKTGVSISGVSQSLERTARCVIPLVSSCLKTKLHESRKRS
jgi:RNA polymerase sigma factor (sigma-70 family)